MSLEREPLSNLGTDVAAFAPSPFSRHAGYNRGGFGLSWEGMKMDDPKDVTLEIKLPQREPTKFEKERRAFLRLLPQLLATHRGEYVAIHDEKVAESGVDRMEVAMKVWKQVGAVDLYVGLVTDEPELVARSGVVRERH
jgi:hypothetical protein